MQIHQQSGKHLLAFPRLDFCCCVVLSAVKRRWVISA